MDTSKMNGVEGRSIRTSEQEPLLIGGDICQYEGTDGYENGRRLNALSANMEPTDSSAASD